jgi:hypothetical protein
LRDELVGAVVEDVLSAVSDLEAVDAPRDAAAVLWPLDLRSGSPGLDSGGMGLEPGIPECEPARRGLCRPLMSGGGRPDFTVVASPAVPADPWAEVPGLLMPQ